jgi:amino acid transporter
LLACGFVLGQVRTLQKYGWIANGAVWLNVIVMILTMAVVTHSHPNYEAAGKSNGVPIGPPAPPVMTTAGPPATVEFSGQVVGLMQAVYSYGGAMLYCEFMSEMRKVRKARVQIVQFKSHQMAFRLSAVP